ncbi:acyl carrier protein [Streptomyces sp. NPDC003753]|uniref:acyl carrier protein n=1 Tax=unclassified Streptomyces TaxID=2593676 RepID=UPI001A5BBA16|nr:acyl carrier protein [Streptomyces sp. Y2F8-2]GHK04157.1 actinorhodin polyketide synthase acyl carrier protein [Streptomyces sp. Y2F8-2]
MSEQMRWEEFTAVVRECAGESESADLTEAVDVSFTDLGYDSVALLEITARIEREYGIALDDEAVSEAKTPGQYLALVNEALAAGSSVA